MENNINQQEELNEEAHITAKYKSRSIVNKSAKMKKIYDLVVLEKTGWQNISITKVKEMVTL